MAAFEEHDNLNLDEWTYSSPGTPASFKEYRLGYACGDWVAYKPVLGRI
ncbi:MAG: hypothetical protein ABSG91_05860 [Syntrophobacteraceae bacterium]